MGAVRGANDIGPKGVVTTTLLLGAVRGANDIGAADSCKTVKQASWSARI
jgi:hypothetical protein